MGVGFWGEVFFCVALFSVDGMEWVMWWRGYATNLCSKDERKK